MTRASGPSRLDTETTVLYPKLAVRIKVQKACPLALYYSSYSLTIKNKQRNASSMHLAASRNTTWQLGRPQFSKARRWSRNILVQPHPRVQVPDSNSRIPSYGSGLIERRTAHSDTPSLEHHGISQSFLDEYWPGEHSQIHHSANISKVGECEPSLTNSARARKDIEYEREVNKVVEWSKTTSAMCRLLDYQSLFEIGIFKNYCYLVAILEDLDFNQVLSIQSHV